MAKFVYTNAKVTLNGTANDVSSSVKQIVLDISAADVDTTNFGSGGWTEHAAGLKSGTVQIDFIDDMAAAGIDSAIWALFGGTAAIGTANPEYQGTVTVLQHPVGGAVGDLATKSVTWPTTGTITRATA